MRLIFTWTLPCIRRRTRTRKIPISRLPGRTTWRRLLQLPPQVTWPPRRRTGRSSWLARRFGMFPPRCRVFTTSPLPSPTSSRRLRRASSFAWAWTPLSTGPGWPTIGPRKRTTPKSLKQLKTSFWIGLSTSRSLQRTPPRRIRTLMWKRSCLSP